MRHPGARFSDPAELYDLIYATKDYAAEANALRAVLHEAGIPDGARVLEGACGTGAYLAPLSETFEVGGFDLDPKMVGVLRRKLPQAEAFVADLATVSVSAPWDAALSLFGGLAYLLDEERLVQGCRALASCVRPGGVVIVEPWVTPEEHPPNQVHMAAVDLPFLKVARQVAPTLTDGVLHLDFHYLVARPGLPVELVRDENRLRLYTVDAVHGAMESAGLTVTRVHPEAFARGLLVGRVTET